MTALEYLKSLILGQEVSEIPVQLSELKLLMIMLKKEKENL